MNFKKVLRDHGVPIALFAIKILTTIRTAADTYAVSRDWLNVLLIDAAFLSLWMLLAYGGDNQYAKRARPFATLGAWSMYFMMLAIGWEAHHGMVAIAVRIAGGIGLLLDTWDYVMATIAPAWAKWQAKRALPPDLTNYGQSLIQKQLRKSVKRSIGKLESHTDALTLDRFRAALPALVDDRTRGLMRNPDPEPTPVVITAIPAVTTRKPVVKLWDTEVMPQLTEGQVFKRETIQGIANCKRSLAADLINHGKELGYIEVVGHGEYVYHAPVQGIIHVSNSAEVAEE